MDWRSTHLALEEIAMLIPPLREQLRFKDANVYIQAVPIEDRPSVCRLKRLIEETYAGLAPGNSYNMLCRSGALRRLYIGSGEQSLSIDGWSEGRETPVSDRHTGLTSSKGSIRLTPATAVELTDLRTAHPGCCWPCGIVWP